mgnify:CR=1 FL=1
MPKRISIFLTGSFIFLIFILFSYLVAREVFVQFDFDTSVRIQDNIPRRFDDALSLLSDIGTFEVLTVVLLVLLAVWRKLSAKGGPASGWKGILFLLSYVGFHLIELYGKFFVAHVPPPEFMLRTKRIFEFPQFHVRAENSYPSGHAGRTVFLSVILLFLIWRSKKLSQTVKLLLTILVVGFDVAMMVSRVYLGEHWVSDVVGGLLLGAGLAVMTYSIAK